MLIKTWTNETTYKKSVDLLGKFVEVNSKDGGAFLFKITGCDDNYFHGYDDERMNVSVAYEDIDIIICS